MTRQTKGNKKLTGNIPYTRVAYAGSVRLYNT